MDSSPMAARLHTDLGNDARDILGPSRLGKSGLFDSEYVSVKLEAHQAGRHKNNKLLFTS